MSGARYIGRALVGDLPMAQPKPLAQPTDDRLISHNMLVAGGTILAGALGFVFPLLMGELQGQQRFLLFSSANVGQAVLKLVAAVALGLALGPVGVVLGVAAAATIWYAIVFWTLRRRLAMRLGTAWLRPALR